MRVAGWILGFALLAASLYAGAVYLHARGQADALSLRADALARQGRGAGVLTDERRAILLMVQDPGFARHAGVDLRTPGAGLTTISQSLARIYHFQRYNPGPEKIPQTIAALAYEQRLTKKQELTLFLNAAYLGRNADEEVRGFFEASRIYFGKPLEALTREQYVTLVAMLIGPDAYHPDRNREALAERVRRIERYLAGECRPGGLRDVTYEACA